MKVAIVHDDLVQWGGAERVLEGLCEIYPDAPIYTSVFDCSNEELTRRFGGKKIITSFLQKIPGWKSLYKALLPLYPLAFEQFTFDDFDLVISHSTRFAKSVITKPKTIHICYCPTPPRFLWRFTEKESYGVLELPLNLLFSFLRVYDQVSSSRVDYFLANSQNTQARIKKVYKLESKVVYPFVDFDRFASVETFDGGYFVVITRLNKYKRVDLAIKACVELGFPLKVIGAGPELTNLVGLTHGTYGVEFLGQVDDETVVSVLAGCRALIIPGIEDFGITSLEAQALGKPVIAYHEGGALETVIEGKTGVFFDAATVESLVLVLREFREDKFQPEDCRRNTYRFSQIHFFKNFKAIVASLV